MHKADKGKVWLLIAALSAVFSYLIIVLGYFPYLGITITLVCFSSLVFLFKNNKSPFNITLYLFTLTLSFFIFYRAYGFLIFLNLLAIFFLGTFMAIQQKDKTTGFSDFLISPLILFFRSLWTKNTYKPNFKLLGKENINKEGIGEITKSFGVSFVILLIIIPLLASANPLFNKLITNLLDFFNLRNLLDKLFSIEYFIWITRIIFFLMLTLFIPNLLTYINLSVDEDYKIIRVTSLVKLLIPKILVSIILFIFFITQLELYFASKETLISLGYTYSQYAREVFGQLSIVALIILTLVYKDKNKSIWSKILTYILIFEGIFLTFIALKSVYDYNSTWGFTYKRLWGYTGVIWILGVFGFYLYIFIKNLKDTYFVKGVILFSAFILVVVNVVNFDSLIFNYKKSVTQRGIDYYYLSGLSSDAKSYNKLLQMLEDKLKNIGNDYYLVQPAARKLLAKIDRLQRKYKNIDLRTFNLSEYLQYREIKLVNVQDHYKIWNKIQPPIEPYLRNLNKIK